MVGDEISCEPILHHQHGKLQGVTQKGPPPGTFAEFKTDLKQRFEEPERARMIGTPRFHARRTSQLKPPKPPLESRHQGELLDTRSWLEGAWESDWDPLDVLAGHPQVKAKLENFSQDLPDDAMIGNLKTKIDTAFGLRRVPFIEETAITRKLGIYQTSVPDPDWLITCDLAFSTGIVLLGPKGDSPWSTRKVNNQPNFKHILFTK